MNATIATLGLAALGSLYAAAVPAETIVVDDQVTVRDSNIDRPHGGMTMQAVEMRYGAPQERHSAVGKPPITRWDYPAFTVFFENDRVIHAVVNPGA
jgi:hypothetical protein